MYRILIRMQCGHTYHIASIHFDTREEAESVATRYLKHTHGATFEIEEVSAAH